MGSTSIPNNSQRQPGALFLSQSNRILIVSDGYYGSGVGTSLFDVKTGVTTPISQLVSSTFAQQYPHLRGMGIDDRGDILVEALSLNPSNYPGDLYIFTPPALSAPTATPEPSSLLIFGLIAGAMRLRTMLRDFQERMRR